MEKKYYWIKLNTDFFNQETIDFLLSQKNGCEYIVLYQMLCLFTANNNGNLATNVGEIIIPYNIEKIVRDTKYFDIDTVTVAMELYKKLGLIYEQENKILKIKDFDVMVGNETKWAEKKRIYREKQEQLKLGQNEDIVREEIEIRDKRLDIRDIDIDNRKNKYGKFQRIKLTDSEYKNLIEEYGQDKINKQIELLDEYIESNNNKNKYTNFNLVLRKSIRDGWFKENKIQVKNRDIEKEIEHIKQLMNTEFTSKHEYWEHSVEDGDYKGAIVAMKKKLEELENEKKRI